MEMQKGFRAELVKYLNIANGFSVDMSVSGSGVYDYSCFGVDENNNLSDDRYMVFYNQTRSPNGEITYTSATGGAKFDVNLEQLPQSIQKLVFTVSIDGAGTMGAISSHTLTVNYRNEPALTMRLSGSDFQQERAIISAEIYRKNNVWRIAAVASGFNGGLRELLKHYGGQEQPESAQPPEKPKPVELRKGQKVSLEKTTQTLGEIVINLNWHKGESKKGLMSIFSSENNAIDLDLGCLFELTDGTKGAVQALGGNFGSLNNPPYISLDGDDRTGESQEGENLRLNGKKIHQIKRILVYTFIYDGIANWKEADGVVTVKCPGSRDVIVRMDEYDTKLGTCAIAMLENVRNETFSVEKLVKFFHDNKEMDGFYNWGLSWGQGSKD